MGEAKRRKENDPAFGEIPKEHGERSDLVASMETIALSEAPEVHEYILEQMRSLYGETSWSIKTDPRFYLIQAELYDPQMDPETGKPVEPTPTAYVWGVCEVIDHSLRPWGEGSDYMQTIIYWVEPQDLRTISQAQLDQTGRKISGFLGLQVMTQYRQDKKRNKNEPTEIPEAA